MTARELPDGWEWRVGEISSREDDDPTYTYWFGTRYAMGGDLVGVGGSLGGFDGMMYHDAGNDFHVVKIYPITGWRDDGDPRIAEYPEISRRYDSREAAEDAVPELIAELKQEARQ